MYKIEVNCQTGEIIEMPLTPEERAEREEQQRLSLSSPVIAAMVRETRNQLLRDSDWTQLPDVPEAIKDLWATYRQALRDITVQEGFPSNIVWPTTPA